MSKYLLSILFFTVGVCNAQSLVKESDTDWDSNSFLQTFIDLDPQGKQVYVFEKILNIKPETVQSMSTGKMFRYLIKGCNFYVSTDGDGNVSSYTLLINKNCPQFTLSNPGLQFNSQKDTLREIISSDSAHRFTFKTQFFSPLECGQICDENANFIEASEFSRMSAVPYKKIQFSFNSNEGIQKWKMRIIQEHRGDTMFNLTDNGGIKVQENDRFNRLAALMWKDEKPTSVTIEYFNHE